MTLQQWWRARSLRWVTLPIFAAHVHRSYKLQQNVNKTALVEFELFPNELLCFIIIIFFYIIIIIISNLEEIGSRHVFYLLKNLHYFWHANAKGSKVDANGMDIVLGTHERENHQLWRGAVAAVKSCVKPYGSIGKWKGISEGCLFLLPADKAFVDGFGYAAHLETQSGSDLAFLSVKSAPLQIPSKSHSGAWRGLIKVNSHAMCYKIIHTLLGIPWEGSMGGEWRLSGYIAQCTSFKIKLWSATADWYTLIYTRTRMHKLREEFWITTL